MPTLQGAVCSSKGRPLARFPARTQPSTVTEASKKSPPPPSPTPSPSPGKTYSKFVCPEYSSNENSTSDIYPKQRSSISISCYYGVHTWIICDTHLSGPVPERIHGGLAMVGFVSALAVELSKGQDVFAQISNGGISLFLGTSILLSVASLIPLFKGVSVGSGCVCSDIQRWNLIVPWNWYFAISGIIDSFILGVSVESKSDGIMTSDAELIN